MTLNILRKNKEEINIMACKFKHELNDAANKEQAQHMFTSAAISLIIHMTSYQNTQDALINLVLDTQHGKKKPLLFSPEQFIHQISIIQNHISPSLTGPGYRPNKSLADVYRLITAKTRVLESTILIQLTIPLISREQFQLFHMVPVPTTYNHQTVQILPSAKYLAITLDRTKYWTMNEFLLHQCVNQNYENYLCKANGPIYNIDSGVADCEVGLLKHRQTLAKTCKLQFMINETVIWIKLQSGNTWIMYSQKPQPVDIICGNTLQTVIINNTNLIIIGQNCQMKHTTTTINAYGDN